MNVKTETKLERADLLEFKLSIETVAKLEAQRQAIAMQLERAQQAQQAVVLGIRAKYAITDADQVNMQTGVVMRGESAAPGDPKPKQKPAAPLAPSKTPKNGKPVMEPAQA